MPGATTTVWGVKLGTGACVDIYDSPLANSCYQFRYAATPVPVGGKAVNYYHSDSCNGSYMGRMVMGADAAANNAACTAMASRMTPTVWGIQRGTTACENITDVGFASACSAYR